VEDISGEESQMVKFENNNITTKGSSVATKIKYHTIFQPLFSFVHQAVDILENLLGFKASLLDN
jgi:hypothetical protein